MRKTNDIEKIAVKERFNSDTEVAEEIVEMELKQKEMALIEQTEREQLISKTYRMMGRIETADMFGKLATVSSLVWLKQVKDTKIYKDLPGVGTWENFCNHLGRSRRHIDRDLENLNTFGEEFLQTVSNFNLGYRDLRKLRKSVSDGSLIIEGEHIVIGDERIPITSDHSEDLQAAIESIIEELDSKLREKEAKIREKDRDLEKKEREIERQKENLVELEREIKARGFEPGEENFIQEMENFKTMIVGLELKMDPRNMPEEFTPLMASAYIETLGHARRTFAAYYDDATNLFGDPDIDDDWIPPNLRLESKE